MLHLRVPASAVDGFTVEAAASVQAMCRLRCPSAASIGERSGRAGLGARRRFTGSGVGDSRAGGTRGAEGEGRPGGEPGAHVGEGVGEAGGGAKGGEGGGEEGGAREKDEDSLSPASAVGSIVPDRAYTPTNVLLQYLHWFAGRVRTETVATLISEVLSFEILSDSKKDAGGVQGVITAEDNGSS